MHREQLPQGEPVNARVRRLLAEALVEVGCPAAVAAGIVDEHAEFEPVTLRGPTLWLYDQGRCVTPDELPDDELREVCRELTEGLRDTNAEMVDRAARGEEALVFWPLPRRHPRRFPRRGRSSGGCDNR